MRGLRVLRRRGETVLRRSHAFAKEAMFVRLTKKLADVLNGIDLSHSREGDVVDLPDRHALLLVADGWAEIVHVSDMTHSTSFTEDAPSDVAANAGLVYDDQPSVAEKLRHYYLRTASPATE
jgi:hypothetical protein